MLIAIDPGQFSTGYCIIVEPGYIPIEFGKINNDEMLEVIKQTVSACGQVDIVIEKIESYGISVSESIFTTIFWCGRYWQVATMLGLKPQWVTRRAVKSNLCKGKTFKTKSWDSKIRQALIDRFGTVGNKEAKGFFYGFSADVWAAFAVGVTYLDTRRK